MTAAQTPHPTRSGHHRQKGTHVADNHFPRALFDTAATPARTYAENPVDGPTLRIPRALIDDLDGTTGTPPEGATDDSAGDVAVSVWTTAQTAPATQRKGRYVAESTAHPAKMLPAVAAYAIAHYTRPGDLVLDPMCGIGTTLVEALHAGRRAVGIEYEPHWVDVAHANLALAHSAGIDHDGRVFHGDARQIASLLPPQYLGQAALVVTSPPYGPSTHGQVSVAPGAGVQKYHHLYGNTLDRGNLANIGHHRLLAGFTRILAGLVPFLRPGGRIAITIRPWREHAELIDLPSQILACGLHAGLIPVERCVALLARAAEHDLVARGSFFQRDFIRKQREAGLPLHLIAHEDVLVFRTVLSRHSSRATAGAGSDVRRRPAPACLPRIPRHTTDGGQVSRRAA
ncbi:TRM11 family SAM-dependent methyltransferase [Actinosynnema sp. ALI-1.44]|uniref:TRM11 family SAM-dependent methyltransferase n=1 Tax=Actinosynnema sp. ALI-1.44 TaxID=1933779 RepID=UPI001876CB02|nr:DNA methyltransferase [Actinosynnema sp. ALI-1.44]